MNPDANTLWRAPALGPGRAARLPRHARAVLDRHLPAGLHRHRRRRSARRRCEMQQTLSAYLFGFAFMNLFHGALSDSFGRRPVVLCGHRACSRSRRSAARCRRHIGALVLLPRAAGHVGRRRHRRLARRHPRHVPAGRRAAGDVAGDDLLRRRAGGRADGRRLPVRARRLALRSSGSCRRRRRAVGRQLEAAARDAARHAARSRSTCATCCAATGSSAASPRFLLLALASGIPFNGMFLYVLSAPVFLGEHLQPRRRREFFWFFVLTIAGIMGGAWPVGPPGRAGSSPRGRSATASSIMLAVSLVNLALNLLFAPQRLVGAVADRALLLRLGADGAGGHAAGARPGARAARHGVVAAGLRRQRRPTASSPA